MKVTYNWLKEFVDFDYSPQQLADHLTMLGFEVELVLPAKPAFSNVFVGKILEIIPHPNSNKLLLCKVTTGKETSQIICVASNISKGDLVPTALIGATLADNTNITKRNILGIDSYGMLCSEKELGLYDTAGGILILSDENTNGRKLKIGSPLMKELELEDTILDINVTPNRGDGLCVIGIAREISALTGNKLKSPKIHLIENTPSTKESVTVAIKAPKLCPRYTLRVIKNIKIKESPFWIKYRMGLISQRAVNNIVDITNYILMEFGQPLHAFDYNTITNAEIIVRTALHGERILTIDNESRILDNDTLVIADKKGPIAIAGIMGGKETEVGPNTKDILLESAYFEPTNIRRSSKKLGLTSESSYRFERSVDYMIQGIASDRTSQLIQNIAGGQVLKGLIDIKKNLPKPPLIKIAPSYSKRILGIDIPRGKIVSVLKNIGCETGRSKNSISVKPPSWRSDINLDIDLAEEIARFAGYAKINSSLPEAIVSPPERQEINEILKQLNRLLTGMGLSEIITYSFINPKDISSLRILKEKYLKLTNAIDKNICMMRTILLPGIINTIIYNINRGNNAVHIFEAGRCFFPGHQQSFPTEELHLAIGIYGNPKEVHWRKTSLIVDFHYLKGIIEEIFRKLYVENYYFQKIENNTFYPGRACSVLIEKRQIGIFGELHPQVLKNFGFKEPDQHIYTAEINVNNLLESIPLKADRKNFQPLPKFPAIRRDMSIVLDKKRESYDIIKMIQEIDLEIIEDIKIFDVYEGSPVPEGKKSIAYAVIYRHKERTLTDEEADNAHKVLKDKILKNIPCEIRE